MTASIRSFKLTAAAQRSRVESLDARQMLAFAAEVNFQPWYTRGETTGAADIGFPYQANGAYTFGWNHWKASEMVQRPSVRNVDASLSTYVPFDGSANEADQWEIAVPNGTYTVSLTAGDSHAIDSTYAFEVEGEFALYGKPSWQQRWVQNTVNVTVTDGKLTVTAGAGAKNNKLNSIRITQTDEPTPPDAPTNLKATQNGANVALAWNTVADNVDGYIVQQRDGNGIWRAIAYRSDSTGRLTVTGINTSIQNQFRVFAYNADGWSSSTNIVTIAALPAPEPEPEPTPVPNPNPNPNPSPTGEYFDGVTVNPEYDPVAVAQALRTLGVNAVRIWGDIEWTKMGNRNWMDAARQYHNLGFHVTLLITDEKVPTYEQAKAYFSFAVSQPGMKAAVDRWEIINEPNFQKYWTGTYSEYVNNVLKPAYEVLNANGEIVVGAAPGVFTGPAQELKDAGYLNYVHYANYHPYGETAAEQIQRINEVKRIFAGKPLTMTEWNLMPHGASHATWVAELKKVRNFVVQNVDSAFYYHLTFTPDWASAGGLFRTDTGGYVPNGQFFDMYDSWNIVKA